MIAHKIWTPPKRIDAVWFWLRVRALTAKRVLTDSYKGRPKRWLADSLLADAPVVAQVRAPLWIDGRADEFLLVAGKVQNLRVARSAFDAVEVPAGAVLSFWRQLGRPRQGRGFVIGREIRSGCVVPTIAGGICQLSNALATCAQRAGFELVERHGHSARIEPGSADDHAADQLDATVFWNHIDLRIRANVAWRIEIQMTADEMIMTLRSHAAIWKQDNLKTPAAIPIITATTSPPTARSCATCQETQCFRHQPTLSGEIVEGSREAWLLDAWTPEFARYLDTQLANPQRMVLTPARLTSRQRQQPNGWHTHAHTLSARHKLPDVWTALRRTLWLRRYANSPGKRQESLLTGQLWLAQMYLRRLPPSHCRLVIDQALLPYLWQAGVLAGRHYDVLVGALPIEEITRRLDTAAVQWPDHESLRDFRPDPTLPVAEMAALRSARKLITPHADIATYLTHCTDTPVHRLDWIMPTISQTMLSDKRKPDVRTIVLAASALPRKGACELATAVRDLPCRVLVLGSLPSLTTLWTGIDIQQIGFSGDWLSKADLLVLPAYVEHQPRAALTALAAGVPVIVSPACGLTGMAGVTEVPAGDTNQLRAALIKALWQNAE